MLTHVVAVYHQLMYGLLAGCTCTVVYCVGVDVPHKGVLTYVMIMLEREDYLC